MKNINTKKFWNSKIRQNRTLLLNSPIYMDKILFTVKNLKKSAGNLLDVGVGYGVLEELLIKDKSQLKLHGIDISTYAIRRINGFKGDFKVGTALQIPYVKSKFNYVVMLDVVEHFQLDKARIIINEIGRVLKRGGSLFLSVPLNENEDDQVNNGHMTIFTQKSIVDLITGNGFAIKNAKIFYAFKKNYFIKSLVARTLGFKKPNLIMIIATKT